MLWDALVEQETWWMLQAAWFYPCSLDVYDCWYILQGVN